MSCVCSSGTTKFLFVGNQLRYGQFRNVGCSNSTEHATDLTQEEYEIIRNCKPATSQVHRVGLVYNWVSNENPNCSQNVIDPYYWGVLPAANRTCVNGTPLTTANSTPVLDVCQVATLLPGSSKNLFYNINWTRCNETHPYICRQNDPYPKEIPECEHVFTTTITTTITTTNQANNNLTVIAAGSASALFLFLLILFFLCCFCFKKMKKEKTGTKNEQQKEHYKEDPGLETCQDNSSNAFRALQLKVNENDRNIYDLPPNEDESADKYSEIQEQSHQRQDLAVQSTEYDDLCFRDDPAAAEGSNQGQNKEDDQYNHLHHFKENKGSVEDYHNLSLNPISSSAIEPEECYSHVYDTNPATQYNADVTIYSTVNKGTN